MSIDEDKIEFIVTFPIYKPFRRINQSFRGKLHKAMKSMKPRYNLVISEINQFLFSSVSTNSKEYLEIATRIKFEEKIDKVYNDFSIKILKELRKMYSKDPELRNSIKAFAEANKGLELGVDDVLDQVSLLPQLIIEKIDKIFKNSSLIIWEMPGKETDRIIAGYEKINREGDNLEEADIGVVSDELALATFGKNHAPSLSAQVERIYEPLKNILVTIEKFSQEFVSFGSEQERELMVEVASVFLGKLLGIREPLNLAEKQLTRYIELENELLEEAREIGSDFLSNIYSKFINKEEIKHTCSLIEIIFNTISENSEAIRQLLVQIENLEINGKTSNPNKQFLEFIAKFYYDLEEFRFITETFQDIPSFTAMGGGVALEGVGKQDINIPNDAIIYLKDVFRTFPLINSTVYALRGVDLAIRKGEFVAIMGASGSGKTTLLNIMSGLDKPDRGTVIVSGMDMTKAREKDLIRFRKEEIAFIYQSYNLLPVLKNFENVSLPADFGISKKIGNKKSRAQQLLTDVGLQPYLKTSPSTLSGGQKQRVTISRALMNQPNILFCDEPTGDLDSKTGDEVMEIISNLNKSGVTVVLVTHDERVGKIADRIINMLDGKIIS